MPVTLPPVQIPDFSRDSRSGPYSGQDTGAGHKWLFEFTSPQRQYVVTWSFLDPTAPDFPRVRIYKSLNGGLSSALQDGANAPEMTGQVFDVLEAGNTLYFIYRRAADSLPVITSFDTTTDTYGTTSAAGPDIAQGSADDSVGFKFVRVNSGDFWVFWNSGLASAQEGSHYAIVSGGVWGSTVVFNAEVVNTRTPFTKLIYDPATDLIHVISLTGPGNTVPVTWTIIHQTVTTVGVISAPDTIGTTGLSNGATPAIAPNVGRSVIWNNFLVVSKTFFRVPTQLTDPQIAVYMGTPVAAPIWTPYAVNTLSIPANEQDYESYAFVSNDGATLFIFFVFMNGTSGNVQQLYWVSTQNGSTWTAPVLFYDAIANPQSSPAPSGNYIHAISVLEVAGSPGVFLAACALQTLDAFSGSECLGYLLIDAAAPPAAPVVVCNNPPNGEVGVAYSHQFLASDGTPPYTWSIGGFAPPGLLLNTSTGILSGIPTLAGTFVFSITVVDSLGATASVTCSITITQNSALTLACVSATQGTLNEPYSSQLVASGGAAPYTFSIPPGGLPTGLTLNTSTGVISGTPTVLGDFPFTATVTDSSAVTKTAVITCGITIVTLECPDLDNPQIPGTIVLLDADTERYLRRFINDPASASTPSDQN